MALSRKPIEIVEDGTHELLVKAPSWERVFLSEIADVQNGCPFESKFFTHGKGEPLIRIRDITEATTENFYDGEFLPEFVVTRGDILIGMDGDFTAARWRGPNGLLNQRVCRIVQQSERYSNKFLFLCLQPYLNAINAETSSITVKHLSSKTVGEIPLPLPPLHEQQRIVAKIEELFSELDTGIENLKQARAQLVIYRQSLLKHAFEGNLTREQRNDDENIPQDWVSQKLGDIAEVSGGLTKNPRRDSLPRKMKYLRVANVYADRLDLDDVREIGVSDEEFHRVLLQQGDLLVVEGNGSIEQIGRVAEWSGAVAECGHQNHLIRARLRAEVEPRFVLRYLQSPVGRDTIVKAASSTSGLHTLSISKVANLRVPVAPLAEQRRILEILEPALDNIAVTESDIDANLQKAEALRQSILKKAFAGELVPQDPNDEPASELLGRIRAERAALAPTPKSKKPRKAALA